MSRRIEIFQTDSVFNCNDELEEYQAKINVFCKKKAVKSIQSHSFNYNNQNENDFGFSLITIVEWEYL